MNAAKTATYKEVPVEFMDAEKLKYCFECGICTASCPMAELLKGEYNPRNILKKIFLNIENALVSDEIWLCPQLLKPPEIFLYARKFAVKAEYGQAFENAIQKIVESVNSKEIEHAKKVFARVGGN
ncbi:MAG: hypothetical protein QXX79_00055 [Candidatus Bathyarchaeia archaeon]